MNEFQIYLNNDIYLGKKVDYPFYIMQGNKRVGFGGVSYSPTRGTAYLEYVELYPSHRRKHHFRKVLLAIAHFFGISFFILEASAQNKPIYEHYGADKIYVDSSHEMWTFKLPVRNLTNQSRKKKY